MKLFKVTETSFENYDNTIRAYIEKVLGPIGSKFSNSQIFGSLLTAIKGIMQNIMFYIEDAFTEQNINTAYRKSSIYSLAKLSGYEPYYGSAATGLVRMTVSNQNNLQSNKIFIKNKSKLVNNSTGYYYTTVLDTDYVAIDTTKPNDYNYIKVVQGLYKSTGYISYGEPLETFSISTNGLYDKDYVTVTVDGIEYEIVSNLYDMTENANQCVVSSGYENELMIMFGNGIHGKQLQQGQAVTISYLNHSGSNGNLALNSDLDLVFKDSLYDTYGNIISDTSFLTLSIDSPISGGTNADSLEVVKSMVGANSRSLVIASEDNFKLFFKRFSFIGQGNIWCEDNSLTVNAVCTSNFKDITDYNEYFDAANNGKILLTADQKSMIKETLNKSNKAFAGINLKFEDPIIRKYALIIYVKVDEQYNRESITENIKKTVADMFISMDYNTSFISKSSVIKTILDNIDGIDAIEITFISDSNEKAKITGHYWKYEKTFDNGEIKYKKVKKSYGSDDNIGLDTFGNIQTDALFEIPVLSNNTTISIDDMKNSRSSLDAIQVLFQ